jgi:hypothetical protein
MPVDVIRLVRGDERPVILLQMLDEADCTPIDLSPVGTEVYLNFRSAGDATSFVRIDCSILDPATNGSVTFMFPEGALDVAPGMYEADVCVDFNGEVETVYERLRFRVRESVA